MTTAEGSALVYVVETVDREYWAVEADDDEAYFRRDAFPSADDALTAHVEGTG